jgi:hypothetical protein
MGSGNGDVRNNVPFLGILYSLLEILGFAIIVCN